MVDLAMERLEERQSSWRPAELVRELAATVPTSVTLDSNQLTGFLERLAEYAVEARCVDISEPAASWVALRRDGRPITEPAVGRTLTTQTILDQELTLVSWAEQHTSHSLGRTPRRLVLTEGLDTGQVEVTTAVAGSRGLELVVGPAGTGKTTALNAGVRNLARQGRVAFGVAPTAAAAEVLAIGTRMRADTLDKLLTEHSHPQWPPQPPFDLPPGTTIILDEAGTASTPKLAALAKLADEKSWRVVMVGDPRQFSPVGRGGMFTHLVITCGAVELDQVHRFRHEWERQASLQLRSGNPGALAEYDRQGRLHSGSSLEMESKIIRAWWTARQPGATVSLMAISNETASRLNRQAQLLRQHFGELDPQAGRLRIGDERLLVGDEIVTRRNERGLQTDQQHMVKNRDHWTIMAIHPDRSITVAGKTGTVRLPADYVAKEIRLGYAQTSHATQGRTVDTALLLVDTPTDHAGIYTPMTRGREANHAYVVTEDNQTARGVLNQAISRAWIDQPALAHAKYGEARGEATDQPGDEERMMRHALSAIEQRRTIDRRARDQGLSL
jgi:ATP-dependent exoDNAse (exonuclease V) alpha subunit